jgi:uncharacterized membrane protein HdeD (DUF308 family)
MATETARWGVPGTRERSAVARLLPPWWLLLLAGVAWIVVSVILLRFNYSSVHAISLLFGFIAIASGVAELGRVVLVRGFWKLFNLILAVAFFAAGVVAFIHPGDTFVALAAIFSFFLIFAGAFDVIEGIAASREIRVWWLQLVGGLIELGLGVWAAGNWGLSQTLLVAWAAAFVIIRGIRDIVFGFRIREIENGL